MKIRWRRRRRKEEGEEEEKQEGEEEEKEEEEEEEVAMEEKTTDSLFSRILHFSSLLSRSSGISKPTLASTPAASWLRRPSSFRVHAASAFSPRARF